MNLKKKKRAGNIIWRNQGLFYTILPSWFLSLSFYRFLSILNGSTQKWKLVTGARNCIRRQFFFDHFPIFKVNLEIRRGTVFKINMTSEWGLYFFFTLDNVRMFPLSYQINFKTVHVLNTRIVVWIRFWRIIKDILPPIE